MPQIPLTQGGGVQPVVEFPRPIPTAALIANLGAEALETSIQLERVIFKDRERRDYNESLIAAQSAMNARNVEALESNDPRTMLQQFNEGIEEDFSAIRQTIVNPLLQQDFDQRTIGGLEASRLKILKDQLSYERQESLSQLQAAGAAIIDSVAIDTSNENLDYARDSIENLTAQAVETLALSPEQAKRFNKDLMVRTEKQIIDALLAAGKHTELEARLEAGDFRSIPRAAIPTLLKAIRKDKQDGNFNDIWYKIVEGGASYELGNQIKQMQRARNLNDQQGRQLFSMNQKITEKIIADNVTIEMVHGFYNGLEGYILDPTTDGKAIDLYASRILDPQLAKMKADAEANGNPWGVTTEIERKSGMIERLQGYIPKSWRNRAGRSIMSLDRNPDEAIAHARMLNVAAKHNPGLLADMSTDFPLAGERAQRINRLREQHFTNDEIVDQISQEEKIAESRVLLEVAKEWDQRLIDDPDLIRRQIPGLIAGHSLILKNHQSMNDYIQMMGMRKGFLQKDKTGFKMSLDDFQELKHQDPNFQIPQIVELIGEDALEPGISRVEGKNILTLPTIGFLNKVKNLGEGDNVSIQFPDDMLADIQEFAKMKYTVNGGMLGPAMDWAIDRALRSYHPTDYEGVPRFARGTIEQHYPTVNDSWDWTRTQLANHLDAELTDQVLPYTKNGGVIKQWEEGQNWEEFMGEVWGILAYASQDDPGANIDFGELPAYAWQGGGIWRGNLADQGILANFPTQVFSNYAKRETTPSITSFTTQESIEHKLPGTEILAPARWIMYEGKDGAYHSINDLVNGQGKVAPFFYDVRLDPDWQIQQRKQLQIEAQTILRNEILMGSSEKAARKRLDDLGFGSVGLKLGIKLHDPTLGVFDVRGPVGEAGTSSQERFIATQPEFDREAFLQDQEDSKRERINRDR